MRLARLAAGLAALAIAGGCIGPRAAGRARPARDDFAIAVPFEDAGGLVIVEVALAGVATPQRFVLDTGAGTTVISSRLDRALGSPRRGHITVIDAAGVRKRTPIARLRTLELGGVRFDDVGAAVIELAAVEDNLCTRIDGILGTNVLQHGVLELDYPGGQVRLAARAEQLPARGVGEPLALVGSGMPYLAIERDGRSVGVLLLDSGSTGALSLPSSLRGALGLAATASGHGMIGVGAHGPVQGTKHAFAWPEATIGGRSFAGVDAVAHESDTGTLGARVLAAYVVRIDYRERTATLWPGTGTPPRGIGSFGFDWTTSARAEVSFVWDGSAAQAAGIALGQVITAVDGQALASLDPQARCELARDMGLPGAPDTHTFVIDGRTLVLEREPLLPSRPPSRPPRRGA